MDTGFAVNIKGADSLGASPFLVAFDTHWARSRSLSSPGMDLHPPLAIGQAEATGPMGPKLWGR